MKLWETVRDWINGDSVGSGYMARENVRLYMVNKDLRERVKCHETVWQPVETAPCGEEVLLWCSGGYELATWGARQENPLTLWFNKEGAGIPEDIITHWMPLSKPPNK